MDKFGILLGKYLETAGITPADAAGMAGCGKSMIYQVLADTRKLSQASFLRLTESVPLPSGRILDLKLAFYADRYPSGTMDRLASVRRWLAGGIDEAAAARTLARPLPLPDASCAFGSDRLTGLIMSLIAQAKDGRVITNFDPIDSIVDDAVYSALRGREKAGFAHLMSLRVDDPGSGNIDSVFSCIRYMRLGSVPLFRFSDQPLPAAVSPLWPCFFASPDMLIMYSHDRSGGVFIRGPEMTAGVFERLSGLKDTFEPVGRISGNLLDFKDLMLLFPGTGHHYVIENSLCINNIMTPEQFDHVASPDLPGRDILVRTAVNYYGGVISQDSVTCCPLDAVKRFAVTGSDPDFPGYMTSPLPYRDRIDILNNVIQRASGEAPKLFFVSDEVLNTHSDPYLGIGFNESGVAVCGSVSQGDRAYSGEYSIVIRDTAMAQDMKSYFDLIAAGGFMIPSGRAVPFIRDKIMECEYLEKTSGEGGAGAPQ